jgi:hypothetical protein
MASSSSKNVGPVVGKWNILEATIGQRGMGKSTWQCHRARQLVREAGGHAYVIGHSLGARLPKELPPSLGGGKLPIEYHRDLKSLDAGLRARPGNWHILAPPLRLLLTKQQRAELIQSTCDDLIHYSAQLSQQLRDRAYDRDHGFELNKPATRDYDGLKCPAIIIIVDEGIAVESAGKGDDKKSRDNRDWFLEWIYSLRHLHTALLYAIQNATARNWQILSEATAVYVFRVKHQWALNAIQAAGGSSAEMKRARKLPPHEHIELGADPKLADDYEETEADPIVDDEDDDEEPSGDRTEVAAS